MQYTRLHKTTSQKTVIIRKHRFNTPGFTWKLFSESVFSLLNAFARFDVKTFLLMHLFLVFIIMFAVRLL
jgi:hypothetical protein